jgi:hypothetical protein
MPKLVENAVETREAVEEEVLVVVVAVPAAP